MPSLAKHPSTSLVKLLALGDSKSGKTSSLVSLVAAGYKLRILDMDNLLDVLRQRILETCPDKLDSVEFRTLRDRCKASEIDSVIDGKPRAWIDSLKMLNRWKYTDDDGVEIDLGIPAEWGPDCILVIDSLTRWCDAAITLHEAMIPTNTRSGSSYDGRAVYFSAQNDVEKQLASLTGPNFNTNVIVLCHGKYIDLPDKTVKLFPEGTGKALSPLIPTYFPNYIQYTHSGGKRTISLKSNHMINLAIASTSLPESLPADTGLAEIFRALCDQPQKPVAQPQIVRPITLRKATP